MRPLRAGVALVVLGGPIASQAPGKWPPDSLVNTHVIPRTTGVVSTNAEARGRLRTIGRQP